MMKQKTRQNLLKQGFTLVELAIVVAVIAALLVGLTFSRTLIETARITSINTKMTKVLENVRVFRQQYGYLPGDIPWSACMRLDSALGCGEDPGDGCNANLSMFASSPEHSSYISNPEHVANYMVSYCNYYGSGNIFSCRSTVFSLRQLARVGMLDGVPLVNSNAEHDGEISSTITMRNTCLPTMHIYAKGPISNTYIMLATQPPESPNNRVIVGPLAMGRASGHYTPNIQTGAIMAILVGKNDNPSAWGQQNEAIDPAMAKKLDEKFDDGNASKGAIQGIKSATGTTFTADILNTSSSACKDSSGNYAATTTTQKNWCNVGYVGE